MSMIFNDLCVSAHLIMSAVLLGIGSFGLATNRNSIIVTVMSLELMFVAPIINLVFFSAHRHEIMGQVFSLFSLGVIAAEAVVGLAIILTYYRNKGNVAVELMSAVDDD